MAAESTSRKYIAVLAALAGMILLVGNKLKPESRTQERSGSVPISDAELLRERLQLQRSDQRRTLEGMTNYFAEAASIAAERISVVPGVGSALVWDASGFLVAPRVSPIPQRFDLIVPTRERLKAELAAAAPDLPIVGIRPLSALPAPVRPIKTLSYEFVQPGEWLVAVARRPDGSHLFAPGNYSGIGPAPCPELNYRALLTTIPLNEALLGGGLFDPDGNLIAVVLECAGQYVAILTEDVGAAIERASSLESRILERFGFRASPLTEMAREYFNVKSGLLVDEIWDQSVAAGAGLAVGDVIVSIGELPVDLPEDLQALFPSDGVKRRELIVRRSGRQIPIVLDGPRESGSAPHSPAGPLGVRLNGEIEGELIESVAQGSAADRAGLQAGDRILRVDGTAATNPTLLQRALNAPKSKPVLIVFQRGPFVRGRLIG